MEKRVKTTRQKIGKTTYIIAATSSPVAKAGLREKVEKLITRDLKQVVKS